MNYILSILFILIIMLVYYLIGNYISKKIKIKNNNFAKKLIIGFIMLFFIGFIVGFPCQVLSTSWYVFATIYTILLILFLFFCIYRSKESIRHKFHDLRDKPLFYIKRNLKSYWLIYFLAILFTIISMANLQPYTITNYNDDYYLVKVVHLAKSSHLLGENYFYGNLIHSNESIRHALFDNYRIFNTFELVYSNLGTIFHINLVFFCRCTMTFHNYLFVFLSYQLIASIFFDDEKAQYALIVFSIFIIPAGYLAKEKYFPNIRMFETWRFQTGMYLGGSITRLMSLPLFIYVLYDSIFKSKLLMIFEVLVVTVFLISFQTTGISYLLLMIPVFIISFLIVFILKKVQTKNHIMMVLIVLSISAVIYVVSDQILNYLIVNNAKLTNLLSDIGLKTKVLMNIEKNYQAYYANIMYFDVVAKYGFIPLCLLILFFKDHIKRVILIAILMIYLIFKVNRGNVFLSLIAFDFYCTARMLTATLMMILLCLGVFIVNICSLIKVKNINKLNILVTCTILICLFGYSGINRRKILTYTDAGDAVIKQGYSVKPLIQNDKMLAPMFVNVANYIEGLHGDKSVVYSPKEIHYQGMKYSDQNLLMSSRKIRHLYYLVDKNTFESIAANDAQYVLDAYLDDRCTVNYILPYIKKANLHYVFITNKSKAKELCENGFKVCVGSDQKGYYLLYYK